MEHIITAPSLNVNDEYVKMVEWTVGYGVKVKKHELVCIIETTKTSFDVESEFDGYVFFPDNVGIHIPIGELMGMISDNPDFDFKEFYEKYKSIKTGSKPAGKENTDGVVKWTIKAEKLAEKLGLVKNEVEKHHSGEATINEDLVNDFFNQLKDKKTNPALVASIDNLIESTEVSDTKYQANRQERVLILGGGGGGILAIDIISRNPGQRAVGILDNNADLYNKTIMGVKVLGGFDMIEELWKKGFFDGVISTIVKDPDERAGIYNSLVAKGIPFTNVIAETANIRLNVEIGKGNLIISGAYFAPCVKIGNNNFFAAESCVEHHSTIGNNCLFGPRFTASGAVTIEDNCKFGMGILVEPYIKIGKNSLVASGSVITNHIPQNSIVKNIKSIKIVEKN